MHGDWFYTTDYAICGHEVRAFERYLPDNLFSSYFSGPGKVEHSW